MTQSEFASYLGPGVASVRRWELGQIQDKAMDMLIRLKTYPAEARQNLRTVADQFEEKCVVSTFGDLELQLTYLFESPPARPGGVFDPDGRSRPQMLISVFAKRTNVSSQNNS
jgi:hypothetical protein